MLAPVYQGGDTSARAAKQTSWPCPICDRATRRLFSKDATWIRACSACGHQLAEIGPTPDHIAKVYDDSYFMGGGAGYPDYLAEAALLRAHGRRYGKLVAHFMAPGSVLDIGSAAGFIQQGLRESGWKGMGIEPNSRMANYARTHLGLDVFTGTIEEFQKRIHFDLVTMIQVIGHFVDLLSSFEASARAARQGGLMLVETWNRESQSARWLGKYWHEYSPPSVVHWFSPADLQRLAYRFGFRPIAHGRPTKWINGAHAKSLLEYKLGDSPVRRFVAGIKTVIPDGLRIPYPAEDLFWILFRKS